MGLSCKIGIHNWNGCKCSKCGKERDKEHDWNSNCERCERCGRTRNGAHNLRNCKCSKCGMIIHDMQTCSCKKFKLSLGEERLTTNYDGPIAEVTIPVDALLQDKQRDYDERFRHKNKHIDELNRYLTSAGSVAEVSLSTDDCNKCNLYKGIVTRPNVPFAIKCEECHKTYADKVLIREITLGKHGGKLHQYWCPLGHPLLCLDCRWGPPSQF